MKCYADTTHIVQLDSLKLGAWYMLLNNSAHDKPQL